MLAGFNSMQMQLGLIPQNTGQQPMGVQLAPVPPPPPVMHPGAASVQHVAYGQQQMQQTLQAAQMTRYVPPPSAPAMGGGAGFGWGGTMDSIARQQFNPYVAGAMGGAAMPGGMPNPMFSTAPQYGMYRPSPTAGGMPMSSYAHVPSVFNPLAPTMAAPHFSTPAMQQYQLMQARQAHGAGTIAGLGEGALGIAGSMLGAGIGGALLGPLGGLAGGWLGGKIGGAAAGMTIGPAMDEIRMGRQLQNTTSPFMVSGSSLNPFTGQGLERGAARDTAHMIRQMTRDHDFQRTGFNTNDVMRLTSMASDQGLLQTAQNPDEIVRKMKDVSRAVKAVMQIAGDPDVRSAMASLGHMRSLGFEGLQGQMGAVANRGMFARMAGVSQSTMDQQYGMPGAMMAQGIGLAGSTGYQMGMHGGGIANVGVSSGSFSDLQLARAGGKQGVAQTNLMAQLGAANQDIYMAAALRRNSAGKLDIDVEAYKRAQTMPIATVSAAAAERMNSIGAQGIFELSTRKQEFKDRLQASLSPTEQMLNVVRQAQGLQKQVGGGMTIGSALLTMVGSSPMGQGMGDAEREQVARTLELQFTNKGFYTGMQQQLRVQRRDAQDRARAFREQYRTPGLLTNMGRGINRGLGAVGDAVSDPFRALSERSDQVDEDRMAFDRGEHVRRYNDSDLIHNSNDQRIAAQAMAGGDFGRLNAQTGRGALANTGTIDNDRSFNRLGQALGVSSYNQTNRLVGLGNQSTGNLFGFSTSYGSVDVARARMQNVAGAARLISAGASRSSNDAIARLSAFSQGTHLDATAIIMQATKTLQSDLPKASLGGMHTAGAAGEDLFRKHAVQALKTAGMSQEAAESAYDKNADLIGGEMARGIYLTGDQKSIETMEKARTLSGQAGSIDMRTARENTDKQFDQNMKELGLKGGLGGKTVESFKNLLKNTDPRVLALAAAQATSNTDEMARIRASYGDDGKFREAQSQASRLFQNQGKDVQDALRKVGSGGQGSIVNRLKEARNTVGVKMSQQALETTSQRLGEQMGDSELGSAASVEDLMSRLAGKDASKISDKGLRDAVQAYQRASSKGDTQGMAAASARFSGAMLGNGASGRAEIFGGDQGNVAGIDKQISDLEEAKKQLGTDAAGVTGQVFADSVELFTQAANRFTDAVDKMQLSGGNPINAGSR